MNTAQMQVMQYMEETLSQEDVHLYEAWKMIEVYVMDALKDGHEPVSFIYPGMTRHIGGTYKVATYEDEDEPLTEEQLERIRAASSATGTPENKFDKRLF